jgi:hypothetical protein
MTFSKIYRHLHFGGPCCCLHLQGELNIKVTIFWVLTSFSRVDSRDSRAIPGGAGNFSPHHRIQNGSEAQPASYPMGTRGYFPAVKRPGREADHSSPSSVEIRMRGSIFPLPQYAFMAWWSVKRSTGTTLLYCDRLTNYLSRLTVNILTLQ